MGQEHFEMQWPRENLFLSGFVHEIMNYRYHWHTSDYELNILLHGSQEFCRGNQSYLLEEDDVLLVSPGVGQRPFQVLCKFKKLIQDMSFVTLGRADFLRFCPCLYYNAVSRHVKQGWLGQP